MVTGESVICGTGISVTGEAGADTMPFEIILVTGDAGADIMGIIGADIMGPDMEACPKPPPIDLGDDGADIMPPRGGMGGSSNLAPLKFPMPIMPPPPTTLIARTFCLVLRGEEVSSLTPISLNTFIHSGS
jgi:hypothetical protein